MNNEYNHEREIQQVSPLGSWDWLQDLPSSSENLWTMSSITVFSSVVLKDKECNGYCKLVNSMWISQEIHEACEYYKGHLETFTLVKHWASTFSSTFTCLIAIIIQSRL